MNHVRYQIQHQTTYFYTGRIDLCHSLAHLEPRGDCDQEVIDHKIKVTPKPDSKSVRKDFLGNTTHYFSVQGSHTSLEITSQLTVEKSTKTPVLPKSELPWETLKVALSDLDPSKTRMVHFLLPTRACPHADFIREFLRPSLIAGKDVIALANDLMTRIFNEFQFLTGATDVSTPIQSVIANRTGVCQDFAHVMIAALRSIGIPSRYVSGYLETIPPPGVPKLKGVDASHAWVEVYSPATGWVGFDPTNNKLPDSQYIKICHGRDYFDVQPVRGIFIGSGKQSLKVSVDVERIKESV